jgi:hypothetical protein
MIVSALAAPRYVYEVLKPLKPTSFHEENYPEDDNANIQSNIPKRIKREDTTTTENPSRIHRIISLSPNSNNGIDGRIGYDWISKDKKSTFNVFVDGTNIGKSDSNYRYGVGYIW